MLRCLPLRLTCARDGDGSQMNHTTTESPSADQAEHARRLVAEEQLALLVGKLAPHMVGNTLATLSALIAVDATAAQKMVAQLAGFLRNAVSSCSNSMRTLEDEFGAASDFLGLIKIRMGPRLNFDVVLPVELRSIVAPAGVLQVLLDNAVTHGLEAVSGPGTVSVSARRVGPRVELLVKNSGPRLLDPRTLREGNGLRYLTRRLLDEYSGRAEFRLSNVEGESAVLAELVIPDRRMRTQA